MKRDLTAETLINLMSGWNSLPGAKFHKAYPFFRPDVQEIVEEYDLGDARPGGSQYGLACAITFAEYADAIQASAIEARRAATEGAVHESAVPQGDAQ